MQIILQEDVEKLGNRGELVEVAEGYARNFLLPRKLALEATAGNKKRIEKMRAAFAKKEASEKESATTLAGLLASVSLEFARKSGKTTSSSAPSPPATLPRRSKRRDTTSTSGRSCWPNRSRLSGSTTFPSSSTAK